MTTLSYPNAKHARNQAAALINFDVIADGDVFHHIDFVSASACCHHVNGRLFRVVADKTKPNGYYRVQIEPLPADIAKICLNRVPKMPEVKSCVPVFGR